MMVLGVVVDALNGANMGAQVLPDEQLRLVQHVIA